MMANTLTEWKKVSWGALATLEYGKGLRGYQNSDGQYPVFGTNGQIGWCSECLCPRDGVIVGRKGAYRGIHYSDRPFFVIDTAFYMKPIIDGSFSLKWAYYQLLDFDINKMDSGSAIPSTSRDAFYAIQLYVPPLPTQRKIAAILSAYDDLIENNLRRIRILEEMAQNLYREWFVKFRFPGHQNARFVDSPLGRIPEEWEVTEFRNIFEIKYGKTLPKTKIAEEGLYPVYGAGDVIGYYDKALCHEKCALVTSRGNGSGTVWRTREAAFVTNNSLMILPKAEFKHWDYSFVELLLKHSNVMEAKTGSAQPQVTIENLNYVKAFVPERPCVEKFCFFIAPVFELVDLYLRKNTTLRRTRDLLLPKLISGEVDVSELEITVPEEAIT